MNRINPLFLVTAFFWAMTQLSCSDQSTASLEIPIDARVFNYTRNQLGFPPLHYAIIVGDTDVVKALTKAGINLNIRSPRPIKEEPFLKEGNTPIEIAVEYDRDEITSILLENGADPHIFTGTGHLIPWNGYIEKIPSEYHSSIGMAIQKRRYNALKALVRNGVDFNKLCYKTPGAQTKTGFDVAFSSGDSRIISIILGL